MNDLEEVSDTSFGGYFSGSVSSYWLIGTWPSGLGIDTDGNLIGTPSGAATYASLQVKAIGYGLEAYSNVFSIVVGQGAPVAVGDSYSVATGVTEINIPALTGVLANDSYTE